MKHSDQLKLLAQVHALREQRAASRTAEARSANKHQRQYLVELEAWRFDYQNRGPHERNDKPVSAGQLTYWREFLAGLDSVIDRQRETVIESEDRLAQNIDELRAAVLGTRVVEQLSDRLETEKRRIEEQSEQEENDDHFAQRRGGGR